MPDHLSIPGGKAAKVFEQIDLESQGTFPSQLRLQNID